MGYMARNACQLEAGVERQEAGGGKLEWARSPRPTSIRSEERGLYLVGQGRQRTEIYVSHRQINLLPSALCLLPCPKGGHKRIIEILDFSS